MYFRDLVAVALSVHFTCFVYEHGSFRQWYPKTFRKGVNDLDQLGDELKKTKASVLNKQVYRVQPTANNYMNVYLY